MRVGQTASRDMLRLPPKCPRPKRKCGATASGASLAGVISGESASPRIGLLADHPDLIPAVGRFRWQEWGRDPEPAELDWWVDVTARESGRDDLPVTFVARGIGRLLLDVLGTWARMATSACGSLPEIQRSASNRSAAGR
jgi:hypothetical protein